MGSVSFDFNKNTSHDLRNEISRVLKSFLETYGLQGLFTVNLETTKAGVVRSDTGVDVIMPDISSVIVKVDGGNGKFHHRCRISGGGKSPKDLFDIISKPLLVEVTTTTAAEEPERHLKLVQSSSAEGHMETTTSQQKTMTADEVIGNQVLMDMVIEEMHRIQKHRGGVASSAVPTIFSTLGILLPADQVRRVIEKLINGGQIVSERHNGLETTLFMAGGAVVAQPPAVEPPAEPSKEAASLMRFSSNPENVLGILRALNEIADSGELALARGINLVLAKHLGTTGGTKAFNPIIGKLRRDGLILEQGVGTEERHYVLTDRARQAIQDNQLPDSPEHSVSGQDTAERRQTNPPLSPDSSVAGSVSAKVRELEEFIARTSEIESRIEKTQQEINRHTERIQQLEGRRTELATQLAELESSEDLKKLKAAREKLAAFQALL